MAKFEISIYDNNDDIIKTHKRNKCTIEMFLKFQEYSERVTGAEVENDIAFFKGLKDLFLEFFPEMTETEYMNNTDVAEVIYLFNKIVTKATEFKQEKNA